MTFVVHAAHRTPRGFNSLFVAILSADTGCDTVSSYKMVPTLVPKVSDEYEENGKGVHHAFQSPSSDLFVLPMLALDTHT